MMVISIYFFEENEMEYCNFFSTLEKCGINLHYLHLNLYISIYLGRNLHVNVKIICNLFPLDHANGSLIIFYVSTTRKSIYIFTKSVKTL